MLSLVSQSTPAADLSPDNTLEQLKEQAALRAELCAAVRRCCPPWLAAESDDLVQEAMLRLWRLQQNAVEQQPLSYAYLKRTAVSVLIDEIRRRKRRRESSATDLEMELDDHTGTSTAPDSAIAAAIQRCLHRQGTQRQQALTLYLLGHSVKESAMLIGAKAKAIENLVYRGLAHLRECLQEQGMEP